MSGFFKALAGLGLGVGLTLGAAGAANATTTYSFNWSMNSTIGNDTADHLYYNGSDVLKPGQQVLLGQTLLTDTNSGATYNSFCVDMADDLSNGNFVGAVASASALNVSQTKFDQITAILSHVDDGFIGTTSTATDSLGGTSADRAAAVQMAIWEVLYDTSYDTAAGNVYETSVSGKAVSEASAILANVTNGTWTTKSGFKVALVRATGNQTQIVYGAQALSILSGIPEPASWAMMVIGFGAIGSTIRRAKREGQTILA